MANLDIHIRTPKAKLGGKEKTTGGKKIQAQLHYSTVCCVLSATACCLLPAACCLLPAACCLLPAACCLLPAVFQLVPAGRYHFSQHLHFFANSTGVHR
jgi:hypothetical protein